MFCLELRHCLFSASPPQEPYVLGWPHVQCQCSELGTPKALSQHHCLRGTETLLVHGKHPAVFLPRGRRTQMWPLRGLPWPVGLREAGRSMGDSHSHATLPGWAEPSCCLLLHGPSSCQRAVLGPLTPSVVCQGSS